MNRIKYAEQLYALISMCLGCAFIVFGLLSFIGILQPTSTSIVQSQRNIGIVFSVLGVAFLSNFYSSCFCKEEILLRVDF